VKSNIQENYIPGTINIPGTNIPIPDIVTKIPTA
jgi:hypothetical protein